ncbi:MAG: DUF5062 family protein [Gammaproteobacteria bacterium]|nr:DUF5062 family protein [Gammaproteobacteria bacterium]NNJ72124.1 DUF5062 family protein [Enterobacterales bacterium]
MVKKIKNQNDLLRKALEVGEIYANKRGYKNFSSTDSHKQKIESIYRLLVKDRLIQPIPEAQENELNFKHKLVLWISHQLPKDHPLLQ